MSEQVDLPEIVSARDGTPARAVRRRVGELLAAGALVALPTETVYGIAARADDADALDALRETKNRPPALALTWHVGTRDAVEGFDRLRPLVRRLVARYWPGPLTLLLEGVPPGLGAVARDGWTGLRLPAHRTTTALLERLDFPVVLSSANRHGEKPLLDAPAVARTFGSRLALVVDGGPARLGEASAVLRVGRGHFDLHREGLLPISDLRRAAGLRLGFVCTGNTCRSPMAAALARRLLEERLGVRGDQRPPDATTPDLEAFGFSVRSMGVFAGSGSPASYHAVEVMDERGIDLRAHRSAPARPEEVGELDRVYCMTESHLRALRALLSPRAARRVEMLDPDREDVPDPIGGSLEIYRRCAAHLAACLQARLDEWA